MLGLGLRLSLLSDGARAPSGPTGILAAYLLSTSALTAGMVNQGYTTLAAALPSAGTLTATLRNVPPVVSALAASMAGGGTISASIVTSGAPVGNVIGIGDSIMFGYNQHVAPIDSMAYPASVVVTNLGIPGVMAASLLTKAQNGDYNSYYSTTKPSIAILQAVGNDIGHNNYGQASDIYGNTQTKMIQLLKSKGFYVAIGTEIPVQMYNSGLAWTQACEDQRIAYNNLVRANSAGADYVIDWAANATIGDAANVNSNTTWYEDGVHPTQLGYNALIPQYQQAVNALIYNPVRAPSPLPTAFAAAMPASGLLTAGMTNLRTVALATAMAGSGTIATTLTNAQPGVFALSATLTGAGSLSATMVNGAAATAGTTLQTTPLKQVNGGTWTYSNNNRTILATNGVYPSQGTVLTVASIVGLKCFAVRCDVNPNTFNVIGINTATLTGSGATPGTTTSGIAAYTSIGVYTNNASVQSNFKYTAGDTVGVVVNQTASRIWFTKDGTNYWGTGSTAFTLAQLAADPTTGLDISATTALGTIYGAVGERDNSGHGSTLLDTYPWTMPSGYSLL